MQKYIWIEVDGHKKEVRTKDYIKAKTKQLIEYGYTTLTEEEVESQLNNIFSGSPLTVIGEFIKSDLLNF